MATEVPPDLIPGILDPVRLAELPADERLLLCKEYMAEENARVRKAHDAGGGGCEVAALRSAVVDGLLCSLFHTAALKTSASARITLVANGGYGRGLLNPGSDIDLLFLLPRASHKLDRKLKDLGRGSPLSPL